jgi:alpha-amylase/alpha-mannosidase (GH57 family)
MHQPFYKDLWNGQYKLPWTRLHALKDYAGMVEVLQEFPHIHQTFNLVPSMVMQIDDYARGEASDAFYDCAVLPAESINTAQRAFILRYFFQANIGRMIYRYPRYAELYEKRQDHAAFDTQDLRDLQIFSQLVWFDEDVLARDLELQELIRKGRDYSLADQRLLAQKQSAALARVLPVYRDFAARGQIEISTTPFYHPILPLLCDSDIAKVANPWTNLPSRFQHPEDAREQLLRARSYMEKTFGVAPVGLWPSEGSVSDQALALAADCGFKWAATDNGVLARTLERDASPEVTYKSYEWVQQGRRMKMLFRDHYLSDLIGFEYSRMGPEEAARHFLSRIRDNSNGRDALVPVILDGENAWEWYEANGRPFLRCLYGEISADPDLEAVTVSEALERFPAQPLDRIFPGSWINANFDIWIGAEEDNQAWERLSEARAAYDKTKDSVSEDASKLAYEELLIAEGSDWCWWYGPEHGSDNRPEFDELYRDHLANVYRALGLEHPANLAVPILAAQPGEIREAPQNNLSITIDGEITSPYEWLGAGHYRPDHRSGAMHGGEIVARDIYFGCNGADVFVRLDGAGKGVYGIEFEKGPVDVRCVRGRVIEMEAAKVGPRFRVTVARDGLPKQTLPSEGWLELGC